MYFLCMAIQSAIRHNQFLLTALGVFSGDQLTLRRFLLASTAIDTDGFLLRYYMSGAGPKLSAMEIYVAVTVEHGL